MARRRLGLVGQRLWFEAQGPTVICCASVVTSCRTLTCSSPPPSRHTCTSSAPDGGCGDQFSPADHQPSAAPAQPTLPSNGAALGTALGDALGDAVGDTLGDTLGDGVSPG